MRVVGEDGDGWRVSHGHFVGSLTIQRGKDGKWKKNGRSHAVAMTHSLCQTEINNKDHGPSSTDFEQRQQLRIIN